MDRRSKAGRLRRPHPTGGALGVYDHQRRPARQYGAHRSDGNRPARGRRGVVGREIPLTLKEMPAPKPMARAGLFLSTTWKNIHADQPRPVPDLKGDVIFEVSSTA